MYKIWDIHFSIDAGGSSLVFVIPYLIPESITGAFDPDRKEILAVMPTDIAGQQADFNFTEGEETKYVTIGRANNTNQTTWIVIHFTLVKASKVDLIIEWFRRGL